MCPLVPETVPPLEKSETWENSKKIILYIRRAHKFNKTALALPAVEGLSLFQALEGQLITALESNVENIGYAVGNYVVKKARDSVFDNLSNSLVNRKQDRRSRWNSQGSSFSNYISNTKEQAAVQSSSGVKHVKTQDTNSARLIQKKNTSLSNQDNTPKKRKGRPVQSNVTPAKTFKKNGLPQKRLWTKTFNTQFQARKKRKLFKRGRKKNY